MTWYFSATEQPSRATGLALPEALVVVSAIAATVVLALTRIEPMAILQLVGGSAGIGAGAVVGVRLNRWLVLRCAQL